MRYIKTQRTVLRAQKLLSCSLRFNSLIIVSIVSESDIDSLIESLSFR